MAPVMPMGITSYGDLLRRIDDGLERVREAVNRLIDNAHRLQPWLGFLGSAVAAALRKVAVLLEKALKEIGNMLTEPGDPPALWRTGDGWSIDFAGGASNSVGTFDLDFLHADDQWKGPAATAYAATLPPQRAALEKIQSVAGDIGDSLRNVAMAIVAFWAGVATAITLLLGELTAAAALTATGVGMPAGVGTATASAVKFIATLGVLGSTLGAYLGDIANQQSRLATQLADNASFGGPPAGHWPVSTTANLSDGSMTDGDDSDWRLRPD
jgi:hypothetical protein